MRLCSQEIGKAILLKDAEYGKLVDFICDSSHFHIRELRARSGVWPLTRDYSIPPRLANFLKSDGEHLFIDLNLEEIKAHYQTPTRQYSDHQTEYFAFEEPWGMPFSYHREGPTPASEIGNGPITSTAAGEAPHTQSMVPYSLADIIQSCLICEDGSRAEVKDVLFDPALMQARFVVLNYHSGSASKNLLFALEWLSQIDTEDNELYCEGIKEKDLLTAPGFDPEDVLNQDAVEDIQRHFNRPLRLAHPEALFLNKSGPHMSSEERGF